jgi:uncharacterized Zn finger protein
LPLDWGGLCKHIVAALFAYSHEPEAVRELPELEVALSGLDREELKDLVLKLAERYPSLGEAIEGEIALLSSSEPDQVNVDAIRRTLRASIPAPFGSRSRGHEPRYHARPDRPLR